MKRQKFQLASVLRFYDLQKQRAEAGLRQASLLLHEMEAEILLLGNEIAAAAALLHGPAAASLSTAGWIACYRKAEQLDQRLVAARQRRDRQAEVVASLQAQRKHWAIKEETLVSLRRTIDEANEAEAAKAQQILLDETVLRNFNV